MRGLFRQGLVVKADGARVIFHDGMVPRIAGRASLTQLPVLLADPPPTPRHGFVFAEIVPAP
jgi:hypothetical protein